MLSRAPMLAARSRIIARPKWLCSSQAGIKPMPSSSTDTEASPSWVWRSSMRTWRAWECRTAFGQGLANDLQDLQFGFRAQGVVGQAVVEFEDNDAAPRELRDRVGQGLAQRAPVHGQARTGDQLAHLALQLAQAGAQVLQCRLAQLRLQAMGLERQVTQLLRHRIVQLTGQGAVAGGRLFALLLTVMAAQAYAHAYRLRRLFQ